MSMATAFDLTQDYFSLFSIDQQFAVDANQLTERYRDYQRKLHPDKFANASDQERRMAVQGVTFVNEAYRTLRDPLLRALYMLTIKGVDPEQSAQSMRGEFLMEQMALREELEELRERSDPLADLAAFQAAIADKQLLYACQLDALFKAGQPEALQEALGLTQEMQFLEKLLRESEALEEALAEEI
jgi:molecular chaperone HscB